MKKNFVLGLIAGGFLATIYFVMKQSERKKISKAINNYFDFNEHFMLKHQNDGGSTISNNNDNDFNIFI